VTIDVLSFSPSGPIIQGEYDEHYRKEGSHEG
jgi:hypothetical protein